MVVGLWGMDGLPRGCRGAASGRSQKDLKACEAAAGGAGLILEEAASLY